MSEENGISVVTVCPVITVDPSPTTVVSMRVAALLSLLSGDQEMINTVKFMERACGGLMLVHVDDLCRCEIFLAEKTSASGRYICCGLNTTVLQLARSLAAKYPRYSVNVAALGDLPEKPRINSPLVGEGFEFKY